MGELTAVKSGHALNNKLLRALHAYASAWEMVSFDAQRAAPIFYPVPVGAV